MSSIIDKYYRLKYKLTAPGKPFTEKIKESLETVLKKSIDGLKDKAGFVFDKFRIGLPIFPQIETASYIFQKAYKQYETTTRACFTAYLFKELDEYFSDEKNIPNYRLDKYTIDEQRIKILLHVIYLMLLKSKTYERTIEGVKTGITVSSHELLCKYIVENIESSLSEKSLIQNYLVEIHGGDATVLELKTDELINNYILFLSGCLENLTVLDLRPDEIRQLVSDVLISFNSQIEYLRNVSIVERTTLRPAANANNTLSDIKAMEESEKILDTYISKYTPYDLRDQIITKLVSIPPLKNIFKFEGLVASYGKYIRVLGGENQIKLYVPISKILNYHPPDLNSHFTGPKRTTEQKTQYFRERGTQLGEAMNTIIQATPPLTGSFDLISATKQALEMDTSFKVTKNNGKLVLFLNNAIIGEYAPLMKSASNKGIEVIPIYLNKEEGVVYSSSDQYNYLMNADYYLIVDGQNRYQIIKQVLAQFVAQNPIIDDLYIEVICYYNIPNEVCNEALKIRNHSLKCSWFLAYPQSNIEKLGRALNRSEVKHCGIDSGSRPFDDPHELEYDCTKR